VRCCPKHDGTERIVNNQTDTTPLVTRAILLTVLAITAGATAMLLLGWFDPAQAYDVGLLLWFFTGLFVLRVVGQILVALQPRQWLPPMQQWNFIPYSILLPIQIVFIVVMVWIDLSFTLNIGISALKNPGTGNFLIIFSYLYALVMVFRYSIRMYRLPDQRWFGGTIPIVFHLVLASYVYTVGSFNVTA
jgi:hypothetical protein